MVQAALRRSSRAIALVLLLVSLVGVAHRQQDDTACLPMTSGDHDASKHAFAPLAPVEHDHCAVCHWMRGLNPTFVGMAAAGAPLDSTDTLAQLPVVPYANACRAQLPARAPPVTL